MVQSMADACAMILLFILLLLLAIWAGIRLGGVRRRKGDDGSAESMEPPADEPFRGHGGRFGGGGASGGWDDDVPPRHKD